MRGVAPRGGLQRRQIGRCGRQERGRLRVGLIDERLLDGFRGRHRQLREADDAVLVDRERERYSFQIQQIERIGQRGPADLLPLQEQPRPIGMLVLDDRHDGDLAVLLQLFETCVPHGHVHSAAPSPGGEDVDDELSCRETPLNDTGRPSAADGSAIVGNASPALNPCGNGALRAQIGLGFGWPAAPAPRATAETAVNSSHMTLVS